jgi:hypothetical protein
VRCGCPGIHGISTTAEWCNAENGTVQLPIWSSPLLGAFSPGVCHSLVHALPGLSSTVVCQTNTTCTDTCWCGSPSSAPSLFLVATFWRPSFRFALHWLSAVCRVLSLHPCPFPALPEARWSAPTPHGSAQFVCAQLRHPASPMTQRWLSDFQTQYTLSSPIHRHPFPNHDRNHARVHAPRVLDYIHCDEGRNIFGYIINAISHTWHRLLC